MWHHDRFYELVMDAAKGTLRFPSLLPGVPPDSELNANFKAFVEEKHSAELPEHRRIDPARAQAKCVNRNGSVSVTLTVLNGDFEYGTRKLIHLVDETFKNFLCDGPYYEYLVEELGLDPDKY
jgi:hypothetical protein